MGQIYLIGFMGAGKTTVARQLSLSVNRPVMDTDEEIIKRIGMSIRDYFAQEGEEAFREMEHEVLKEISRGSDAIISCGGGVALRADNLTCMQTYGKTFWLTATPETILRRVKRDESRPLLNGKKSVRDIEKLMGERVRFYEKAADYQIVTDGKSPKEIAREIAEFAISW